MVMAPAPVPLAPVVNAFVDEVDGIESIFFARHAHRSVVGPTYQYLPIEDGCLVSLWDAWSRFIRYLVLRSASGESIGLSGAVYSPGLVRTEAQVLQDLADNRQGNNFGIVNGEPKWFNPANLSSVMSFLGLANHHVILGAVGATTVRLGPIAVPSPIDEVRKCRNFVAHKAPGTLADVRRFGHSTFVDLSTHMRSMRSGVETFSEWGEAFRAIAEAAAQ